MNPDIKRAWVEALRSGEYEQCYDALSDGKGFCCLGVLCELAVNQKIIKHPVRIHCANVNYAGSLTTLPSSVARWAELLDSEASKSFVEDTKYDPVITYKSEKLHMSSLNDGLKLSFKEIADLIESQL